MGRRRDSHFQNDFLDEHGETLSLKWVESQKVGQNIGFKQPIQLWFQHRALRRTVHPPASDLAETAQALVS